MCIILFLFLSFKNFVLTFLILLMFAQISFCMLITFSVILHVFIECDIFLNTFQAVQVYSRRSHSIQFIFNNKNNDNDSVL